MSTTTAPPVAETGAPRRYALATSLPILGLTVLLVQITRLTAQPIRDPDTWWHLRMGREFWAGNWSLMDTGQMTPFATEAWYPRDWLPQLVVAKVEEWFGLPGVAWFYGTSLLVFVVVVYAVLRRQADPLPAAFTTALVTFGASGSLSPRPQTLSFILLALTVAAWLATTEDLKPRWWLVPLMWVWAASHGMWYFGVAVGITVVTGLALDRRLDLRTFTRLAAVVVASIAAAALTPVGPRILVSAFATADNWAYVSEWQPPSFLTPIPAITLGLACVVVLSWARAGRRVGWTQIGLLMLAVACTVAYARTIAVGAVVLGPLAATAIQTWVPRREARRGLRPAERLMLGVAAIACSIGLAITVPQTSDEPAGVPSALNDELDALPAGTPLLNEYGIGGWLHWRHPDIAPVIDGFTDAYTTSAIEEYRRARAAMAGWQDYVRDNGTHYALLMEETPLVAGLRDQLGWITVGEDEEYVLLRAPSQ